MCSLCFIEILHVYPPGVLSCGFTDNVLRMFYRDFTCIFYRHVELRIR